MKTKSISFNDKNYECRVVVSNEGEELIIGSIELLDALHPGTWEDENEGFASKESEDIYNGIFYFTDKDTLKLDDAELVEELKAENSDWF